MKLLRNSIVLLCLLTCVGSLSAQGYKALMAEAQKRTNDTNTASAKEKEVFELYRLAFSAYPDSITPDDRFFMVFDIVRQLKKALNIDDNKIFVNFSTDMDYYYPPQANEFEYDKTEEDKLAFHDKVKYNVPYMLKQFRKEYDKQQLWVNQILITF